MVQPYKNLQKKALPPKWHILAFKFLHTNNKVQPYTKLQKKGATSKVACISSSVSVYLK